MTEETKSFALAGGCLCGAVRYTVLAPARSIVHCHCSQCRRSHATLIGTSATIDRDKLKIETGEAHLSSFEYPPGNHRKFCRTCGNSIFYVADELPGVLFYFPATLDNGAHPGHSAGAEHHIHLTSRAHWEPYNEMLPEHECGIDRATLLNER